MADDNQSAERKHLGSIGRKTAADEWVKLDAWDEAARNRNACLELVVKADTIEVYEKPGVYDGPRTKRPHVTVTTAKAVA